MIIIELWTSYRCLAKFLYIYIYDLAKDFKFLKSEKEWIMGYGDCWEVGIIFE